MDIKTLLELAQTAETKKAMEHGGMTVGHLMDMLMQVSGDTPVVIYGRPPSALMSYRGYYERLAFEVGGANTETRLVAGDGSFLGYQPGADAVRIKTPATVADVLEALSLMVGEEFEGYKGGQFKMHLGTILHVAQYGQLGDMVVGVGHCDGVVELVTAPEAW